MKPIDSKVITYLNEGLKAELTATNQYFLHAKMSENWGYYRIAERIRKESIEEMRHAESFMTRILFLEGIPIMTDPLKIKVGKSVPEQMANDLKLEQEAVDLYRKAVSFCLEVGDHTSRELFEHILRDEEEHVDWLEGQLGIIKEIGVAHYLSQQMHKDE